MTLAFKTLSQLSVFATDQEIATAVVGRTRAEHWRKNVLPILEARGFPRVDALHGGRSTLLVAKFYDGYFGITAGFTNAQPDGEEDLGAWTRKRTRKRSAAKERSDLWTEKKRKALEEFRAKKVADRATKEDDK